MKKEKLLFLYLIGLVLASSLVFAFNINVQCPASAKIGDTITCQLNLDQGTPTDKVFAVQFVIKTMSGSLEGATPFIEGKNGVTASSEGVGKPVILYKLAVGEQKAGPVAEFKLIVKKQGNWNVELQDLVNAEGSKPATIVVSGFTCVIDANCGAGFVCDPTTKSCKPAAPCGNGVIDSGEECDGTASAAGAKSCLDLGYKGGTVTCIDCKLQYNSCTLSKVREPCNILPPTFGVDTCAPGLKCDKKSGQCLTEVTGGVEETGDLTVTASDLQQKQLLEKIVHLLNDKGKTVLQKISGIAAALRDYLASGENNRHY